MDFWSALQIYLVVAAALAGTSYWNIYKPAISLLEEILEVEKPLGPAYAILWGVLSFIMAPLTAVILLSNNNNQFIERLAVTIANSILEEDE